MKRFQSLVISTLLALAAVIAAPNFAAAQLTTVVGQTVSSPLAQASVSTSQGGAVTNPSSNLIVNVSPGPIICYGNDLQYINQGQLTLTANSTNLIVWNCGNNSGPALYAKQAVTGPGSLGTSAINQPGTPNSILYAIPQLELPLATVVCGSTNCGNSANGSITDNRNLAAFPVVTDWFEFVPAVGACSGSVSGNSTGTNGPTTVGGVSVVQDDTSVTGTNTHTYACHIPLPSKTTAGKGVINILDATFLYGVQTAAIGTQVATLASGTLNSVAVFQTFTAPVPAASETPSGAIARADTGTAAWTPAVASFNTGTTTAGQFYSEKFVPGSTLALSTDLVDLTLTVTLQMTATTATITNTPGYFVHYAFVPF